MLSEPNVLYASKLRKGVDKDSQGPAGNPTQVPYQTADSLKKKTQSTLGKFIG
jgi:hypothetical protein